MIIGIDGNEANVPHKVGVSVYTLSLLAYFQKHATKDIQFVIYLKSPPLSDLPVQTEWFRYAVIPGKVLWSKIFLPKHFIFNRSIDLFFSPAHYIPSYTPCPVVVTIHDLAFRYFPAEFLKRDLYKLSRWTKESIQKSLHVIAVSEATKKDILSVYTISADKVTVIHNGFEKNISPSSFTQMSKQWGIDQEQYILYVGTLQPRKNIQTLIKAFSMFKKNNPSFKLVLVGKKGWLYEDIFKEVIAMNLESSVIFTDYLSDSDVVSLYQHAYCYVMPSFYEGFGIPVLEAMSFGCPVVSSDSSSLPEIGGDACLYFDPNKSEALVEKLEELADSKTRSRLKEAGLNRVKDFSWSKSAEQTLDLFLKLGRTKK